MATPLAMDSPLPGTSPARPKMDASNPCVVAPPPEARSTRTPTASAPSPSPNEVSITSVVLKSCRRSSCSNTGKTIEPLMHASVAAASMEGIFCMASAKIQKYVMPANDSP